MSERNIIDEIDALVDAQLEQEASGYDHNINQADCPHCGDDWHGLPITQRMRRMRLSYCGCTICETALAEYRRDEDDTPLWCPGSAFIGPVANPAQLDRIRAGEPEPTWPVGDDINRYIAQIAEQSRAFAQSYYLPAEQQRGILITDEDFARYDYSVGAPVYVDNYSGTLRWIGRVERVEQVEGGDWMRSGRRIYLDRPIQRPQSAFFVYVGRRRNRPTRESQWGRAWASLLRTAAALDVSMVPQIEGVEPEGEISREIPDGEPMFVGDDYTIGERYGSRDWGENLRASDTSRPLTLAWSSSEAQAPELSNGYSLSAVQAIRQRMWAHPNPFSRPGWQVEVGDDERERPYTDSLTPREGARVAFVMPTGRRVEGVVISCEPQPSAIPGVTGFSMTIRPDPGEFGAVSNWLLDEPVPEPETPQQRALPRPSHTPPMWANNPTRQNRRRNR
ncbi:hypothetical protein AXA44_02700 [Rhodococcus sp. SC4]|nr:hypothetical protein AXA44_02700 [Rhodococcus sp. SC4]